MVQSRFAEMTEVCAADFEASIWYSLVHELLYILDFSSNAHHSFEVLRKQRGKCMFETGSAPAKVYRGDGKRSFFRTLKARCEVRRSFHWTLLLMLGKTFPHVVS
jgi:hypothetical protein